MRPSVLLGSFVIFIAIQISLAKMCPYRTTCLKELGYEQSVLTNAYGYRNKIKEGDEKINKYWACCWIKQGFLTEDGEFIRTPVQRQMYSDYKQMTIGFRPESSSEGDSDSFTNGLLDTCEKVLKSDPGDFVVKMKNCIIDEFWKANE